MSSRAVSNLAESFYEFISSIHMKKWWEFIRILGLPENDIDEISYEDDDVTEQKYQMLSRWKSFYGYKKADSEIVECLRLAQDEIVKGENASPELLNRKLHGQLFENRLIAKKFYDVMLQISMGERNRFALVKLQISDREVCAIASDYSKDVDEQCYQMLLSWKRRNKLSAYAEIRDALEKALIEFLNENSPGRQAHTMVEQLTSDAGMPERGRPNNQAPSGDQYG